MKMKALTLCVGTLFIAGVSNAQTQVPNTFQSGQPARASEVNENFDVLETAINQNTTAIGQIPAGLALTFLEHLTQLAPDGFRTQLEGLL